MTMQTLGQKMILGITGSVAAYKSAEIIRQLQTDIQVQVVMTAHAQSFITPLTLQALSRRPVYATKPDRIDDNAMEHINLARWADSILIAPASANFIAKLAHGIADDLLTTLCLATQAPIFIAPAMNRYMWENPATQANCKLLKQRHVLFLEPEAGEQACGEHGIGRMQDVHCIVQKIRATQKKHATSQPLAHLKLLVSAGPTCEPLDPIRYLTNRSSGKMGYALAQAGLEFGAHVTLVSGPTALTPPENVHYIAVTTAQEMLAAIENIYPQQDIFISAAAVSDYRPSHYSHNKIKKGNDTLQTTWLKNPDILSTLTHQYKHRPFTVGFAAETSDLIEQARLKLKQKKLDLIAANQITWHEGLQNDENALTVIWENTEVHLPKQSKYHIAKSLLRIIAEQYKKKRLLSTQSLAAS